MASDWSREIQREYIGGEVRFTFPIRPLGWGRLMGVFLIGFGILFIWGPAHDIWHTIQKWLSATPSGGERFFSLFELPFLIGGLIPMAIGLSMLFGRCRVEWKDGQLRATELLGPLRWKRRIPRQPVGRLEVAAATSTNQDRSAAPKQIENFSSLMAVFADGSKKVLVMGYPKEWLLGVAEELKGYVGGNTSSFARVKVEVVENILPTTNDADVPKQPAESRVQITETVNGLQLKVPPAGIWRGSKGFFFSALIWCAFMTFFTIMIFLPSTRKEGSLWVIVLFVLGFWAIGLGMLALAINLGRRTAELVVGGNSLRVETKGLFGAKQRSWTRNEITAIRADSSGMEVNHKPVLELQIHPRTGKKIGLLAGRKDEELRWLATRLRQSLNVPARQVGG